jgi:hypothetical protein
VSITNNKAECSAIQERTNPKNWFCFGGEKGKSACFGDSGGPVMVREDKAENRWNEINKLLNFHFVYFRWTLAGIISGNEIFNIYIIFVKPYIYQVELSLPVVQLVDMAWLWMCTGGLTGSGFMLLMENIVS